MPTFSIKVGNAEYEVDAPDEQTAYKWANATHVGTSVQSAPVESAEFKAGRGMSPGLQAAGQLGKILSLGTLHQITPGIEQKLEGGAKQFAETHPTAALGVDALGTILTGIATGGLGLEAKAAKILGPIARGARSMVQAAVPSAIQGGLESDESTLGGMLKEGLKSGAMGAAGAAGLGAVGGGLGMAARNVGERVGPLAVPAAQRRLAITLSRGMPEGYAGTPAQYAAEQLRTLGDEARLFDVNPETRRLADVLATVPGRAKTVFEPVIEQRQSGRYGRILNAADEALGKQTGEYMPTLNALIEQRAAAAKPLYEQVQNLPVQVDDEMLGLLRRAGTEALEKSNRLARLAGEDKLAVGQALKEARDAVTNASIPGKPVPFGSFDHIKQSLYDLETSYARNGHKTEAAAFGKLRRQLTDKLDRISPKDDQGQSIYALARKAFEGPSQLADAMEMGRFAFNRTNQLELRQTVQAMSDAEREAFQVGAIQALREKAGSQSGQTALLKQWKEENTAGPLRMIFGDKYDDFARALKNESTLKQAESIGQGSQTASRLMGAGDLDAEPILEAGNLVGQAASGNLAGIVGSLGKTWNRVQLPEKTRNQLALLLSQGGNDAQTQLQLLNTVMQRMNRNAARSDSLAAALGSIPARTSNNK